MSVTTPAYSIKRLAIAAIEGQESEWVKMFDPRPVGASPPTPELMDPTNPVPEVMAKKGLKKVSKLHTEQRDLLNGLSLTTWDNKKKLLFFTFRDSDLVGPFNTGVYPAPTTRVPRGVIFHSEAHGQGPPPHTIHWHGIEPTPLNDGVGHCSLEFGTYFFQWQPNFIGSYFYHCHRNTPQHFEFGLFGDLLIMPPDAYFATQNNPVIPVGAGRDGKFRTAANLSAFPQFPGFNPNPIDAPDPLGQFQTDPHAMTVPYDVEAIWVLDDRDSVWSDLAPDAFATFPVFGDHPGFNDNFHAHDNGFFSFNDFHPDYFFVTGVPVPGPVGGTATINPSAAPPLGGIGGLAVPDGLIPAALNSGVSGSQIAVNASANQTILIRCLDAAYARTRITFPLDAVIIAWDGRALGVAPFNRYNHAYLLPAGTPITISTARRFDALIRPTAPSTTPVKVEFLNTRADGVVIPEEVVMTALIPFNIGVSQQMDIKGTVLDKAGAPLVGVTMKLTGAGKQAVVTDDFGNYGFTNLVTGKYVVNPSLKGYEFDPSTRKVTYTLGHDVTGVDFTGEKQGNNKKNE